MHKRTLGGLAAATAMTAALGLSMSPAQASPNDDHGRSTAHGDCTLGSTWFLRAAAGGEDESDKARVLFRIHSATGGQIWDWQIADNGTVQKTGESVSDQNGDLTVRRRFTNQDGSDMIDFTATNTATGEVCTGTVTLKDHE